MQPHANRFPFCEALGGFLLAKAAENRSTKTLDDYRYSLGLCAAHLGDTPLDEVTTDDLRRFIAHLRRREPPLAAKTIRNVYVALSSFWTWASGEFGIANPLRGIAPPKTHAPALRLPTREEVARVLSACERSRPARTKGRRAFVMRRPTAARDRAIILVLLDSGLRAGELCGLRIADLDLAAGSILVRRGKGNKQRMVYIGKAARRALWRYLAGARRDARPDDPLFLSSGGRPLAVDHLSHLVGGLGQRAGVKLHPHVLRHLFATEFLRGGGSTLALRRLLGHVSDAMLARYGAPGMSCNQEVQVLCGP